MRKHPRSRRAWPRTTRLAWVATGAVALWSVLVHPMLLLMRSVPSSSDTLHNMGLQQPQLQTQTQTQLSLPSFVQECPDCRQYWRYDRAAVPIRKAVTWRPLPAVPVEHRLLVDQASDVMDYLRGATDRVYPHAEYFFDYNPSIVRLADFMTDDTVHSNNNDYTTAHYLASFRVSNQHSCLHPQERRFMNGNVTLAPRNYLGLALLNGGYETVESVVLDVPSAVRDFAGVEDFRLFVLQGQLYLTGNDILAPMVLGVNTAHSEDDDLFVPIPLVFPAHPTGTTLLDTVRLRSFVSCAPCRRRRARSFCGKNFNYFADGNATMVEIWPSPPHLVRSVDVDQPCDRRAVPTHEYSTPNENLVPTFGGWDEVAFRTNDDSSTIWTRGRGSACCLRLPHPRRRNNHNASERFIRVGLWHKKTPSQGRGRSDLTPNHYMSQWYAVEDRAPYRLLAISGPFCLGLDVERLSSWRVLNLTYASFPDCPRIHFVSGLSLHHDDPDTALVVYGVNDCYSRLVTVSVDSIVEQLFPADVLK